MKARCRALLSASALRSFFRSFPALLHQFHATLRTAALTVRHHFGVHRTGVDSRVWSIGCGFGLGGFELRGLRLLMLRMIERGTLMLRVLVLGVLVLGLLMFGVLMRGRLRSVRAKAEPAFGGLAGQGRITLEGSVYGCWSSFGRSRGRGRAGWNFGGNGSACAGANCRSAENRQIENQGAESHRGILSSRAEGMTRHARVHYTRASICPQNRAGRSTWLPESGLQTHSHELGASQACGDAFQIVDRCTSAWGLTPQGSHPGGWLRLLALRTLGYGMGCDRYILRTPGR
jgi:hypothetical protein